MTNPSRRNTLAGIGFMLLSVMLFSLSGAIGKRLVGAYPIGEALLIRSMVALVLLAPFLWREGLVAFTMAP
jgi:drug/metabolite transporter (DMT)-like permease